MLYDAYEVQRSFLAGASKLAGLGAGWLNNPANPWGYSSMGPLVAASLEVFAHASAPRGRPEFGIERVRVGRKDVAVREEIALSRPFGNLKHLRKDGAPAGPPLLIVAPMSGHYATLLRGTVQRLLPAHDIFITDWADAKLVPLAQGSFDLDDYVYEALRAGASGFLLKDSPRHDLIAAVRAAAAGDALLAPSVTRRLIEAFARRPPETSPSPSQLASLTARERDVLLLLARGRSNAEIAAVLFVSEATVKTHVGNLLAKLGLRDRVQAVILAYETGIVVPGAPQD